MPDLEIKRRKGLGILAMTINYGVDFVNAISKLYIGYDATIAGIIIGAIWGFFDAGIGVLL
jgi:hypothetical protein